MDIIAGSKPVTQTKLVTIQCVEKHWLQCGQNYNGVQRSSGKVRYGWGAAGFVGVLTFGTDLAADVVTRMTAEYDEQTNGNI
jgi:hypothetical protein